MKNQRRNPSPFVSFALITVAFLTTTSAQAVPPAGSLALSVQTVDGEAVPGLNLVVEQIEGQWPDGPIYTETPELGILWISALPGLYNVSILNEELQPIPSTTITVPFFSSGKTFAILTLPPLTPDLDADGFVGFNDLLILLSEWGACPAGTLCPTDLDASGDTGFADLLILLSEWDA